MLSNDSGRVKAYTPQQVRAFAKPPVDLIKKLVQYLNERLVTDAQTAQHALTSETGLRIPYKKLTEHVNDYKLNQFELVELLPGWTVQLVGEGDNKCVVIREQKRSYQDER